jgi:hypothetical protein
VAQILVTFSGPGDPAKAQGLDLYRLVTAGEKGSFTAKNATIITPKPAAANAVDHAETLALKKPLKPVRLQVNGLSPRAWRTTSAD